MFPCIEKAALLIDTGYRRYATDGRYIGKKYETTTAEVSNDLTCMFEPMLWDETSPIKSWKSITRHGQHENDTMYV